MSSAHDVRADTAVTQHTVASAASTSRRSLAALLAAFLLLAAATAHHFAVTALHVAPTNPLRVATSPYVLRYLSPLFEQRWNLFAPNPGRPDYFILAACRLGTDGANGAIETTPTDATLHLLDQNRKRLLAPAQRVARLMMAPPAMLDVDQVESKALELVDSPDPRVAEAALQQARALEEKAQIIERLLARVASVECRRSHPVADIAAVRASVVWITLPPFSRRHDPTFEPQVERTDFDWQPYVELEPYWKE